MWFDSEEETGFQDMSSETREARLMLWLCIVGFVGLVASLVLL